MPRLFSRFTWRAGGAVCLALAALLQLWLAGRLAPAGGVPAAADYLAVIASLILALVGVGLAVLGHDAARLLRGED